MDKQPWQHFSYGINSKTASIQTSDCFNTSVEGHSHCLPLGKRFTNVTFPLFVMQCRSSRFSCCNSSYPSSEGPHIQRNMQFEQTFVNSSRPPTLSNQIPCNISLFQRHDNICHFRINCNAVIYQTVVTNNYYDQECSRTSLIQCYSLWQNCKKIKYRRFHFLTAHCTGARRACVHTYILVYVCVCVCMYVCIYLFIYLFIYIFIYLFNYLFIYCKTTCRPALVPPSLLLNGYRWIYSVEIKRLENKSDKSPTSVGEVMDKWNCTFTPSRNSMVFRGTNSSFTFALTFTQPGTAHLQLQDLSYVGLYSG
jgi:hypothetical protein